MKIDTLFFDLGKVLLDFDFNLAFHRVAARSPLDLTRLRNLAYPELPLIADYESGRVTTAKFFTVMREHFQFAGDVVELEQIWCDVFTPLTVNIACARSLAAHYPLAIISNTSDAHIRFVEAQYDFFGLFQKRVYSHQVGCLKPGAEIYQIALREMRADGGTSLFIDDLAANVSAGLNAVQLPPGVTLPEVLHGRGLRGM
ncbi:MAG: HAD hydrolase-like protein [Verrucomicrobiales bacterium]|nr:HAD hydrolase-like protein [Verrucomicrobiales bacterium]